MTIEETIMGKAAQLTNWTQYVPPLYDVLPTHPLMPLAVYFTTYGLMDKTKTYNALEKFREYLKTPLNKIP